MFKGLIGVFVVAVVAAALAMPISAQAAEGGGSPSTSTVDPHVIYTYQLWVFNYSGNYWWPLDTYDNYADAQADALLVESYGMETYILVLSIYDSRYQHDYPWRRAGAQPLGRK